MFKKESKEGLEDYYSEEDQDDRDLQDTIIAQGVKVEGDFNSKGNVVIEGVVLGSVKTNNNLQVGEKAKITASVSAHDAYVAGIIEGNVKIKEKLELSPTSRIYGDIEAKTLVITAGALFNGKCSMFDPDNPKENKTSKKLKKEEDASEEN
ncbi:MAG: cell shape determination protein CcmA [Parcubacteria group bacterium CG10_big_fil_rev_8_21_14_0_10_36_14]|nr:MAG: cell shape determination protein CcmA [Parcubacteria group bacterium CG10_big_fil_rev_8_21_14_0_10_36_14]